MPRLKVLALPRLVTPIALLVLGAASVAGIFPAHSETTKDVMIGLASTLLTAGAVDLSAGLESRRRDKETARREQAILGLATERATRASRQLTTIVRTVFGVAGQDSDLPGKLRASTQEGFDPDQPANVYPPRPKGVWISQCVAELDESLGLAVALGTQTAQSELFGELDRTLRTGPFSGPLHSGVLSLGLRGGADVLAREAARVVERAQALMDRLDAQ